MVLSGIETFLIFGFTPLMIGILAAPEPAQSGGNWLTGTLVIPEFRSAPADALATIELLEDRHCGSSRASASRTFRWEGGRRQAFALGLDFVPCPAKVRYSVRGRIATGNTALFQTRAPQPVDLTTGASVTLALVPVLDA